jgi:hypothetical protein
MNVGLIDDIVEIGDDRELDWKSNAPGKVVCRGNCDSCGASQRIAWMAAVGWGRGGGGAGRAKWRRKGRRK